MVFELSGSIYYPDINTTTTLTIYFEDQGPNVSESKVWITGTNVGQTASQISYNVTFPNLSNVDSISGTISVGANSSNSVYVNRPIPVYTNVQVVVTDTLWSNRGPAVFYPDYAYADRIAIISGIGQIIKQSSPDPPTPTSYTVTYYASPNATQSSFTVAGDSVVTIDYNGGAGTENPGGGSAQVTVSSNITISWPWRSGYTFKGYSRSGNTLTATWQQNVTPKYDVIGTTNDWNRGWVGGAGEYAQGASVTVTANPYESYRFIRWEITGGVTATSTNKNYTFTMPAANVTAKAIYAMYPCYIYSNSKWRGAIPYIYRNSAWSKAEVYIYSGGQWKTTKL